MSHVNLQDRSCALCASREGFNTRIVPGLPPDRRGDAISCFYCWGPQVIKSEYPPIPARLLFTYADKVRDGDYVDKTWVEDYYEDGS